VLQEFDDIDTAALKHRTLGKIKRREAIHLLNTVHNFSIRAGQKTCAYAIGVAAEAEIKAGRLNLGGFNPRHR
jgi:hypothetical protein